MHCVCTVLLFDETSKDILTYGVAADVFERGGAQIFLIFGSLYKLFGRDLAFFMLLEGVFQHFFAVTWAILQQSGQKFVDLQY